MWEDLLVSMDVVEGWTDHWAVTRSNRRTRGQISACSITVTGGALRLPGG